jgi:hypothetical protein
MAAGPFQRSVWRQETDQIDPSKLIFLDESGVATEMTRRCGRALRGDRVCEGTPRPGVILCSYLATPPVETSGASSASHICLAIGRAPPIGIGPERMRSASASPSTSSIRASRIHCSHTSTCKFRVPRARSNRICIVWFASREPGSWGSLRLACLPACALTHLPGSSFHLGRSIARLLPFPKFGWKFKD